VGAVDLAYDGRVVIGDVGGEILDPVLQLDVHAGAELLDAEGSGLSVDTYLLADPLRFLGAEPL